MSPWPSTRARRVLAVLNRIGWKIMRQSGSYCVLECESWANFVFVFHDRDAIGPKMLARIARHTALTLDDLKHRQCVV